MKKLLYLALFILSGTLLARIEPQRLSLKNLENKLSTTQTLGSGKSSGTKVFFPVGDGEKSGLFTVIFNLPPHSRVEPHSHPDARSCFVLKGDWYIGYGSKFEEKELMHLETGSHYTEPANGNHFAATKENEVTVECTGIGPTGTTFVK